MTTYSIGWCSQQNIQRRLYYFVSAVCSSAIFRRVLRYNPAEALEQYGMHSHEAPNELPVRHYEVNINLDHETLFGLSSHQFSKNSQQHCEPPLDLRLVSYGARPLALLHGSEEAMTSLAKLADNQGLVALLSPFEFTPQLDVDLGGFSNLATAQRPAKAGSGAWRGLLVAKDETQVMLGWLSLLFGWDTFLGRLLGYPRCCVDSFSALWPRAREQHRGDLLPLIIETYGRPTLLGPFHWGANQFARYLGYHISSHFPCCFECPETIALAERLMWVLKQIEPEEASRIRLLLSAPVLYAEDKCTILFVDAERIDSGAVQKLLYDTTRCLVTDPSTELAQTMLSSGLLSFGDTSISCKGSELPGNLIFFDGPGFDFATSQEADSVKSSCSLSLESV